MAIAPEVALVVVAGVLLGVLLGAAVVAGAPVVGAGTGGPGAAVVGEVDEHLDGETVSTSPSLVNVNLVDEDVTLSSGVPVLNG